MPPGPEPSPPPPSPGSPALRQLLGAVAVTTLLALFVGPVVRRREAAGQALAPSAVPLESTAQAAAPPSAAFEALQAASDELKEAAASALSTRASAAAPAEPAPAVDNVTVCIQSFVPEGTFGTEQLDWVCRQPDLWSIQLDLHARALKRGSGAGAQLWTRLGRFELAAIAVFRTACCGSSAPLSAKVPSTSCGSLADALRAVASDPSAEQADRYEQTMDCLAKRQVWFPESWSRIHDEQERRAFDEFLAFVRKR